MDAERGLILTNRHVVTPGAPGLFGDGCPWCILCFLPLGCQACPSPAGPVTAEAIFHNREEVAVKVGSSSDVKLLDLCEAPQCTHRCAGTMVRSSPRLWLLQVRRPRHTALCGAATYLISCQAKPYSHPCRFDPAEIKFQKLASVPLYPEGAEVGVEVRVVVSVDAFASLAPSLHLTRTSAPPAAGK